MNKNEIPGGHIRVPCMYCNETIATYPVVLRDGVGIKGGPARKTAIGKKDCTDIKAIEENQGQHNPRIG